MLKKPSVEPAEVEDRSWLTGPEPKRSEDSHCYGSLGAQLGGSQTSASGLSLKASELRPLAIFMMFPSLLAGFAQVLLATRLGLR